MKKVVFFVSSLKKAGGIEKVTSIIASSLADRGVKVEMLTFIKEIPFFYLSSSIKITVLRNRNTPRFIGFVFDVISLFRYLNRERPDDFICVGASLYLYAFLPSVLIKGKYMLWEHFSTEYKWNKYTSVLSRNLAAWYCDLIIVLNADDQQYYLKQGASNVHILPNPISICKNSATKIEKKNVVLSVGRCVKVKGFDLLLKAWQLIPDKKDWLLYIVGEGEEKNNLYGLLDEYGISDTVRLFPATNSISDYYEQASIYALSSRSECFPLVLLEAETFSLPIICFNCGDGVRTLVKDGYNGYVVPMNDVSMYARKMCELMGKLDSRQTMGENGLKISMTYSLESIINKWKLIL